MFGIGGSSSGRSRVGSDYSTKTDRKQDEDETPSRRRSRTGSTVSSSSKRKSSHRDNVEQDGGFNPSSTSFSSSSKSPYAGVAAPSIASSYATAYNTGLEGESQPPELVRNDSMRKDVEPEERRESRRESKSSSKGERRRTVDENDDDRKSSARSDGDKGRRRSSRKSSSKSERRESTRAMSEHDAALPQNQFFSDPSTYTAPYRPPGHAAEYYGDQGESVQYQPGVRPNPPSFVVNAEQAHLQTPSVDSKPPPEPSSSGQLGAAASFYTMHSSGDEAAHQNTNGRLGRPSKQTSGYNASGTDRTSPAPGGRVSNVDGALNSFGAAAMAGGLGAAASYYANSQEPSQTQHGVSTGSVHNLHSQQSQYQSISSPAADSSQVNKPSTEGHHYGTAATMGLAGAAAGAYYANHHHHQHSHQNSSPPGPEPNFSLGDNQSAFPGMRQRQKHRHRGPMTRFVDWFRDPEGVAQFEEWSEYVGVCKDCFDPHSTPADAPRKHHHHLRRKASSGGRKGSTLRVDKTYRYSSSDEDRKKRSSTMKKVAGAGIAGLGAAAVGEALYKSKHDFDDTYSVQSGRPYNDGDGDRYTKRQSKYSSNDDGRFERKRSSRKSRRDSEGYRESRTTKRRDSSGSEKGLSRGAAMSIGAGAAGLAIAAEAAHRRKSRSRSRSPSKRKYYSKRVSPRHSYVDLASTQDSPGFGSFFSSPSANKSKGKKPKGLFHFSNVSSSSSDADLAFGEGTVRRKDSRKSKNDRTSRKKENNEIGDTAAILGLAATGVALAAESDRRKEKGKEKRDADNRLADDSGQRHKTKIALQDHETTSDADNDDIWEDASDDESVDSVEAGLAYGGRHSAAQSRESLVSDQGTSKWAWRWDKNKDKREEKARQRRAPFDRQDSASYDKFSSAALGASLGVAAASISHEPSPMTVPPLQHIDPIPTSDSTPVQDSRRISLQKFVSASPVTLEQPQPLSPVAVPSRLDRFEAAEPLTESPPEMSEPRERRSRADFESRELSSVGERDSSPGRTGPFNASTLSKSSVTFNLTDEQLENERRLMKKDERRRSKLEKQKWRMSADVASLQEQTGTENLGRRRSASMETKSAREMEIEAELEKLYKEHRRQQSEKRKLAEERQYKVAEEIKQSQISEPEEYTTRSERSRQNSSASGIAAIAIAAAAGAGIATTALSDTEKNGSSGEEDEKRSRRSKSKEDSDLQTANPLRESQQARIARMAAQRIKSGSPVYEDYSKFFTPEDIAEHVKEHNAAAAHRDDLNANIIEAVPGAALSSERRVSQFDPENYRPFGLDPDDDPLKFPWRVPSLSLIEPTPPHSMMHSPRAPASPISYTKEPDEDTKGSEESIGEPLERRQSTGSRVTWGDYDTYVYEVQTPEYERVNPTEDLPNTEDVERKAGNSHEDFQSRTALNHEEDVDKPEDFYREHTDEPEDFYRSSVTKIDSIDGDVREAAFPGQPNQDRKPRERSISPPRAGHSRESATNLSQEPLSAMVGAYTVSSDLSSLHDSNLNAENNSKLNSSEPPQRERALSDVDNASIATEETLKHDRDFGSSTTERMPGGFESDHPPEPSSPPEADKTAMNTMRQVAQAAALAAMTKRRSSETRMSIDKELPISEHVAQETGQEIADRELPSESKSYAAEGGISRRISSKDDRDSREDLDSVSVNSTSSAKGEKKKKKKSRRRSRRDSDYSEDNEDFRSSTSTSTTRDANKNSRRRSNRDLENLPGNDTDAARFSSMNGDDDRKVRRRSEPDPGTYEDVSPLPRSDLSKNDKKRRKSAGIFSSFFSSGKPDITKMESSKSKSEGGSESRGSKKRRSRSSTENLASDSRERQSEDGLISADVAFPDGKKDHSPADEQPFLEKRPEMPQPTVSTDMPMDTDGVSGLHMTDEPFSEQKDDFGEPTVSELTSTPAKEGQPIQSSDTLTTEEVKQSPEEESELPSQGRSRALSTLQTSEIASSPVSTSSPTAVPLHFRRPPLTPRGSRDIESSPIATPLSPLATPRTRQSRPKSTEFTSKEVRPLYLVERINQAKVSSPQVEETYPSLPSSRTTSANPSTEDLRGLAQQDEQFQLSPSDKNTHVDRGRRHSWQGVGERRGSPEYLDSRSATPVPGDKQRARDLRERKELPKYLFHSPSELLQDPSQNQEVHLEDIEARSGSPLPSIVSTDLDQDFMSAESRAPSPVEERYTRSHSAPMIDDARSTGSRAKSRSVSRPRSSSIVAATGLGLLTGATIGTMGIHGTDDEVPSFDDKEVDRDLPRDPEPNEMVIARETEASSRLRSHSAEVLSPEHALQDDVQAAEGVGPTLQLEPGDVELPGDRAPTESQTAGSNQGEQNVEHSGYPDVIETTVEEDTAMKLPTNSSQHRDSPVDAVIEETDVPIENADRFQETVPDRFEGALNQDSDIVLPEATAKDESTVSETPNQEEQKGRFSVRSLDEIHDEILEGARERVKSDYDPKDTFSVEEIQDTENTSDSGIPVLEASQIESPQEEPIFSPLDASEAAKDISLQDSPSDQQQGFFSQSPESTLYSRDLPKLQTSQPFVPSVEQINAAYNDLGAFELAFERAVRSRGLCPDITREQAVETFLPKRNNAPFIPKGDLTPIGEQSTNNSPASQSGRVTPAEAIHENVRNLSSKKSKKGKRKGKKTKRSSRLREGFSSEEEWPTSDSAQTTPARTPSEDRLHKEDVVNQTVIPEKGLEPSLPDANPFGDDFDVREVELTASPELQTVASENLDEEVAARTVSLVEGEDRLPPEQISRSVEGFDHEDEKSGSEEIAKSDNWPESTHEIAGDVTEGLDEPIEDAKANFRGEIAETTQNSESTSDVQAGVTLLQQGAEELNAAPTSEKLQNDEATSVLEGPQAGLDLAEVEGNAEETIEEDTQRAEATQNEQNLTKSPSRTKKGKKGKKSKSRQTSDWNEEVVAPALTAAGVTASNSAFFDEEKTDDLAVPPEEVSTTHPIKDVDKSEIETMPATATLNDIATSAIQSSEQSELVKEGDESENGEQQVEPKIPWDFDLSAKERKKKEKQMRKSGTWDDRITQEMVDAEALQSRERGMNGPDIDNVSENLLASEPTESIPKEQGEPETPPEIESWAAPKKSKKDKRKKRKSMINESVVDSPASEQELKVVTAENLTDVSATPLSIQEKHSEGDEIQENLHVEALASVEASAPTVVDASSEQRLDTAADAEAKAEAPESTSREADAPLNKSMDADPPLDDTVTAPEQTNPETMDFEVWSTSKKSKQGKKKKRKSIVESAEQSVPSSNLDDQPRVADFETKAYDMKESSETEEQQESTTIPESAMGDAIDITIPQENENDINELKSRDLDKPRDQEFSDSVEASTAAEPENEFLWTASRKTSKRDKKKRKSSSAKLDDLLEESATPQTSQSTENGADEVIEAVATSSKNEDIPTEVTGNILDVRDEPLVQATGEEEWMEPVKKSKKDKKKRKSVVQAPEEQEIPVEEETAPSTEITDAVTEDAEPLQREVSDREETQTSTSSRKLSKKERRRSKKANVLAMTDLGEPVASEDDKKATANTDDTTKTESFPLGSTESTTLEESSNLVNEQVAADTFEDDRGPKVSGSTKEAPHDLGTVHHNLSSTDVGDSKNAQNDRISETQDDTTDIVSHSGVASPSHVDTGGVTEADNLFADPILATPIREKTHDPFEEVAVVNEPSQELGPVEVVTVEDKEHNHDIDNQPSMDATASGQEDSGEPESFYRTGLPTNEPVSVEDIEEGQEHGFVEQNASREIDSKGEAMKEDLPPSDEELAQDDRRLSKKSKRDKKKRSSVIQQFEASEPEIGERMQNDKPPSSAEAPLLEEPEMATEEPEWTLPTTKKKKDKKKKKRASQVTFSEEPSGTTTPMEPMEIVEDGEESRKQSTADFMSRETSNTETGPETLNEPFSITKETEEPSLAQNQAELSSTTKELVDEPEDFYRNISPRHTSPSRHHDEDHMTAHDYIEQGGTDDKISAPNLDEHLTLDDEPKSIPQEIEDPAKEPTLRKPSSAGPEDLVAAGTALGIAALSAPDVVDEDELPSEGHSRSLDDEEMGGRPPDLEMSDVAHVPAVESFESPSLEGGLPPQVSIERSTEQNKSEPQPMYETYEQSTASIEPDLSAPPLEDRAVEDVDSGHEIIEKSGDSVGPSEPTAADHIRDESSININEPVDESKLDIQSQEVGVDQPASVEEDAWAFSSKKSKKDKKKKRASRAGVDSSEKAETFEVDASPESLVADGERSTRVDDILPTPEEMEMETVSNNDKQPDVETFENGPQTSFTVKKSKKDKKKRASLFNETVETPTETSFETPAMMSPTGELQREFDAQASQEPIGKFSTDTGAAAAPETVQPEEEWSFGIKKTKKDKKKKKRQSIPGAFDSGAATPAAETPVTLTEPSSPQVKPLSESFDNDMEVEEVQNDQELVKDNLVSQEVEESWSFPTKQSKKDKKKKRKVADQEKELGAQITQDVAKSPQRDADLPKQADEGTDSMVPSLQDQTPPNATSFFMPFEETRGPAIEIDQSVTKDTDTLVDPMDVDPVVVVEEMIEEEGSATTRDAAQDKEKSISPQIKPSAIVESSVSPPQERYEDDLEARVISEAPEPEAIEENKVDRTEKKTKKKKKGRRSLPLETDELDSNDRVELSEATPSAGSVRPDDEPTSPPLAGELHSGSLKEDTIRDAPLDADQESDTGSNVSEATRERRRRRKSPPVWSGEEPDDLPRSPRDRALTPPPDHDDIMDTALGVAAGLGFGTSDQDQPVADPTKRQDTTHEVPSWSFANVAQDTRSIRDSGIQFEESPIAPQEDFNTPTRDSGYVASPVLHDNPQGHARELPDSHRSSLRPPRPRSPTSSAEDISTSRYVKELSGNQRSAFETPSRRQPSPIESTSKDRDSGLFKSSPAFPTPSGARVSADQLQTPTSDIHRSPSIHGHHHSREELRAGAQPPRHRRVSDELSSSLLNRTAVAEIDPEVFSPSPRQSLERVSSPTKTPLHTIDENAVAIGAVTAAGLGTAAMLSREDSRSRAKSLGQSNSQTSSHRDLRESTTSPFDLSSNTGVQEQSTDAYSADRSASMADVFDGFGAAPGSPRSPTRPPSLRKRQSLQQIVDLQARVEQLASENRQLAEQKVLAERHIEDLHLEHSKTDYATQEALETVNAQLRERDEEITKLRTEIETLISTRDTIRDEHEQKYTLLLNEKDTVHAQWQESSRELGTLRDQHQELSVGMEGIVRSQIDAAVADKDAEIQRLRNDLEKAREKIRELQAQILTRGADEVVTVRDEDYFDSACQQLCQHVQQWVLRFSKFSDTRVCRSTHQVRDEKIVDRFDNAILDGSDVDVYLSDRVKRRDVFMSVVMAMIWEFVFTRYLFGMDRDQRQKLKQLEKNLAEVGPTGAIHQWRALTLTLLSKRAAFKTQKENDLEAVASEVFQTLAKFLPPPSNVEAQCFESLRNVMRAAVNLSIEMRTQKAEYIMLPPLQPEYDTNGDLARKVFFNAGLMNERSGDYTSNDELERDRAVVRMVLFPLVVKKGDDSGAGEEEFVVCPAQVLVAKQEKGKRPKSRIASGESQSNRAQSRMSAMDAGSLQAASTHSLGAMSGVVTGEGNMI